MIVVFILYVLCTMVFFFYLNRIISFEPILYWKEVLHVYYGVDMPYTI